MGDATQTLTLSAMFLGQFEQWYALLQTFAQVEIVAVPPVGPRIQVDDDDSHSFFSGTSVQFLPQNLSHSHSSRGHHNRREKTVSPQAMEPHWEEGSSL